MTVGHQKNCQKWTLGMDLELSTVIMLHTRSYPTQFFELYESLMYESTWKPSSAVRRVSEWISGHKVDIDSDIDLYLALGCASFHTSKNM